jgi:hypothetical protein
MQSRKPGALRDDPMIPGHFLLPRPETLAEWIRGLEAMGYLILKPGELRIVDGSTTLLLVPSAQAEAVSAMRRHAESALLARLGQDLLAEGLAESNETVLDGTKLQITVRVAVRVPPTLGGKR